MAIRQEKRNKVRTDWEERKIPLLTVDMIVYVGIPNKLFLTNQNTPRTIECSKVSAYKINIDNLITFLYTGDEHVEAKTKNIIPFTITPKKKKYLIINLAKCVQDLYSKPWTKFHTLYRN